ncbi:MAG: hypothetical protein HUU20_06270 [Pirellulales bacterium]|nr:hypothetical protein [Pirellulales bacterium]
MQRLLLLALALGFTLLGPMAAFRAPDWLSGSKPSAALTTAAPAGPAPAAPQPKASPPVLEPAKEAAPPASPVLVQPALEGFPSFDLAEVFRFDISPGWIMSRWSRVSAGLGMLQLQGYRVPLVTGTAENDLAGSLTYYYNSAQQVQRITFSGTTGDSRKLVQFLMGRYRFARRVANDPSLFIYEIPEPQGPPKSLLEIRPARLLRADLPYQRFEIELSIERPQQG